MTPGEMQITVAPSEEIGPDDLDAPLRDLEIAIERLAVRAKAYADAAELRGARIDAMLDWIDEVLAGMRAN